MDTVLINENDEEQLLKAAELIKNGEIVGMPTETVYGLAADACNETAVAKIFKAKGRPSDNPLIVHLSRFSDAEKYTGNIPALAYKIAENFCPGPITMILPKNDKIPYITSGGLDTVGIRIPAHKTARKIIELSGCPIAAPSANTSGYPSPTSAKHVMYDMNGKIPAIVDGGDCKCGVESTVISFDDENTVRILRPGFITKENLNSLGCNVIIDNAILHEVAEGERVSSPGMKYKHYSPKANVTIVEGSAEQFIGFMKEHQGDKVCAMMFGSDAAEYPYPHVTYGDTSEEQARELFGVLRSLDDMGMEQVYARCPEKTGVGLAVYNRLLRAAGFEVIRL